MYTEHYVINMTRSCLDQLGFYFRDAEGDPITHVRESTQQKLDRLFADKSRLVQDREVVELAMALAYDLGSGTWFDDFDDFGKNDATRREAILSVADFIRTIFSARTVMVY